MLTLVGGCKWLSSSDDRDDGDADGDAGKGAPMAFPKEVDRVETATVLERAGAGEGLGQRTIDAAFLDADRFVVLVDGGGSRYVAAGAAVAQACPGATSITGGRDEVAVGCSDVGSGPQVQIFDMKLGTPETITLAGDDAAMVAGTAMTWPAVDRAFSRAALPADNDRVSLHALTDGARQASLSLRAAGSPVVDMAFSNAGDRLAVAHEDGNVEVFDPGTPSAAPTVLAPPEPDQGPAVEFSPTGEHLAVASFWGQFRLFTVADGSLVTSDKAPGDRYGHNDVTFAGPNRIVQARAGALVLRDAQGKVGAVAEPDDEGTTLFGLAAFGPIARVSGTGDAVLAVDADGRATVLAKF